ncbi:MAG: acetate/propionate family kinase [Roseiarcus sp.]
MSDHVLTLNAGSSSIKFALFDGGGLVLRAAGEVEGLGGGDHARLSARAADRAPLVDRALTASETASHEAALAVVLGFLGEAFPAARIAAVGHRVVHGGAEYDRPARIDDAALARLASFEPLAPLHQPHNVSGIRAARAAFPDAPQIACFDTAFHRGHAFENDVYALPRAFYEEGVRRYGFHGLSFDYVARRLAALAPDAAKGRVVAAHLGNGASLCAMRAGKSVATTLGFSTLDGVPMGTRPGQLDPGVLLYLMEARGYDAAKLSDLLHKHCGLAGLSGISNDLRDLEASDDPRAAQAISYFTHRIRYEIAGLATTIGGLDALVFCGGIGEHSARVRLEAMRGLAFLGVVPDEALNAAHAPRVSAEGSPVAVYIVPTNEELRIAELTAEFLARP